MLFRLLHRTKRPTGYSITAEIDVTRMRRAVKFAGLKFFPSVEAGKLAEREGAIYMPLSLTCHHATTDGYHINKFLTDFQTCAHNFEVFL